MAPPSACKPSPRQVSGFFWRGGGGTTAVSCVSPAPPQGAGAAWGAAFLRGGGEHRTPAGPWLLLPLFPRSKGGDGRTTHLHPHRSRDAREGPGV